MAGTVRTKGKWSGHSKPRVISCPQRHLAMFADSRACHHREWSVLLASSGRSQPGRPLNVSQCLGQPNPTKTGLPQNISSAKVKEPWFKQCYDVLKCINCAHKVEEKTVHHLRNVAQIPEEIVIMKIFNTNGG